MRIFGSSRKSRTSTDRATNVATNVARAGSPESAERSETELARVRVFHHDGAGQLLGNPLWLDVPAPWEDADRAFGAESQFPAPLAI